MGVPSNTTETYSRVGIREDLADVIYNISPVETPFISNAGKGSATRAWKYRAKLLKRITSGKQMH